MRYRVQLTLAGLILAIAPSMAIAGFYKCISPQGTATFSDRPCKDGEKEADVKDNAAFSGILAKENDKRLGMACSMLARRNTRCRSSVDSDVQSLVQLHCSGPMRRYEYDRNRARNWRDDREDDYQEKSQEELRCSTLQEESWKFVKDNFANKVSEQEIKRIEYNINGIHNEGNEMELPRKRRR